MHAVCSSRATTAVALHVRTDIQQSTYSCEACSMYMPYMRYMRYLVSLLSSHTAKLIKYYFTARAPTPYRQRIMLQGVCRFALFSYCRVTVTINVCIFGKWRPHFFHAQFATRVCQAVPVFRWPAVHVLQPNYSPYKALQQSWWYVLLLESVVKLKPRADVPLRTPFIPSSPTLRRKTLQ